LVRRWLGVVFTGVEQDQIPSRLQNSSVIFPKIMENLQKQPREVQLAVGEYIELGFPIAAQVEWAVTDIAKAALVEVLRAYPRVTQVVNEQFTDQLNLDLTGLVNKAVADEGFAARLIGKLHKIKTGGTTLKQIFDNTLESIRQAGGNPPGRVEVPDRFRYTANPIPEDEYIPEFTGQPHIQTLRQYFEHPTELFPNEAYYRLIQEARRAEDGEIPRVARSILDHISEEKVDQYLQFHLTLENPAFPVDKQKSASTSLAQTVAIHPTLLTMIQASIGEVSMDGLEDALNTDTEITQSIIGRLDPVQTRTFEYYLRWRLFECLLNGTQPKPDHLQGAEEPVTHNPEAQAEEPFGLRTTAPEGELAEPTSAELRANEDGIPVPSPDPSISVTQGVLTDHVRAFVELSKIPVVKEVLKAHLPDQPSQRTFPGESDEDYIARNPHIIYSVLLGLEQQHQDKFVELLEPINRSIDINQILDDQSLQESETFQGRVARAQAMAAIAHVYGPIVDQLQQMNVNTDAPQKFLQSHYEVAQALYEQMPYHIKQLANEIECQFRQWPDKKVFTRREFVFEYPSLTPKAAEWIKTHISRYNTKASEIAFFCSLLLGREIKSKTSDDPVFLAMLLSQQSQGKKSQFEAKFPTMASFEFSRKIAHPQLPYPIKITQDLLDWFARKASELQYIIKEECLTDHERETDTKFGVFLTLDDIQDRIRHNPRIIQRVFHKLPENTKQDLNLFLAAIELEHPPREIQRFYQLFTDPDHLVQADEADLQKVITLASNPILFLLAKETLGRQGVYVRNPVHMTRLILNQKQLVSAILNRIALEEPEIAQQILGEPLPDPKIRLIEPEQVQSEAQPEFTEHSESYTEEVLKAHGLTALEITDPEPVNSIEQEVLISFLRDDIDKLALLKVKINPTIPLSTEHAVQYFRDNPDTLAKIKEGLPVLSLQPAYENYKKEINYPGEIHTLQPEYLKSIRNTIKQILTKNPIVRIAAIKFIEPGVLTEIVRDETEFDVQDILHIIEDIPEIGPYITEHVFRQARQHTPESFQRYLLDRIPTTLPGEEALIQTVIEYPALLKTRTLTKMGIKQDKLRYILQGSPFSAQTITAQLLEEDPRMGFQTWYSKYNSRIVRHLMEHGHTLASHPTISINPYVDVWLQESEEIEKAILETDTNLLSQAMHLFIQAFPYILDKEPFKDRKHPFRSSPDQLPIKIEEELQKSRNSVVTILTDPTLESLRQYFIDTVKIVTHNLILQIPNPTPYQLEEYLKIRPHPSHKQAPLTSQERLDITQTQFFQERHNKYNRNTHITDMYPQVPLITQEFHTKKQKRGLGRQEHIPLHEAYNSYNLDTYVEDNSIQLTSPQRFLLDRINLEFHPDTTMHIHSGWASIIPGWESPQYIPPQALHEAHSILRISSPTYGYPPQPEVQALLRQIPSHILPQHIPYFIACRPLFQTKLQAALTKEGKKEYAIQASTPMYPEPYPREAHPSELTALDQIAHKKQGMAISNLYVTGSATELERIPCLDLLTTQMDPTLIPNQIGSSDSIIPKMERASRRVARLVDIAGRFPGTDMHYALTTPLHHPPSPTSPTLPRQGAPSKITEELVTKPIPALSHYPAADENQIKALHELMTSIPGLRTQISNYIHPAFHKCRLSELGRALNVQSRLAKYIIDNFEEIPECGEQIRENYMLILWRLNRDHPDLSKHSHLFKFDSTNPQAITRGQTALLQSLAELDPDAQIWLLESMEIPSLDARHRRVQLSDLHHYLLASPGAELELVKEIQEQGLISRVRQEPGYNWTLLREKYLEHTSTLLRDTHRITQDTSPDSTGYSLYSTEDKQHIAKQDHITAVTQIEEEALKQAIRLFTDDPQHQVLDPRAHQILKTYGNTTSLAIDALSIIPPYDQSFFRDLYFRLITETAYAKLNGVLPPPDQTVYDELKRQHQEHAEVRQPPAHPAALAQIFETNPTLWNDYRVLFPVLDAPTTKEQYERIFTEYPFQLGHIIESLGDINSDSSRAILEQYRTQVESLGIDGASPNPPPTYPLVIEHELDPPHPATQNEIRALWHVLMSKSYQEQDLSLLYHRLGLLVDNVTDPNNFHQITARPQLTAECIRLMTSGSAPFNREDTRLFLYLYQNYNRHFPAGPASLSAIQDIELPTPTQNQIAAAREVLRDTVGAEAGTLTFLMDLPKAYEKMSEAPKFEKLFQETATPEDDRKLVTAMKVKLYPYDNYRKTRYAEEIANVSAQNPDGDISAEETTDLYPLVYHESHPLDQSHPAGDPPPEGSPNPSPPADLDDLPPVELVPPHSDGPAAGVPQSKPVMIKIPETPALADPANPISPEEVSVGFDGEHPLGSPDIVPDAKLADEAEAVVESPEASDTAPLGDATDPDHAPDSTATDGTAPLDSAVPVDPEPHDVNPVFPIDPLAEAPASAVSDAAVPPNDPPISEAPAAVLSDDPHLPGESPDTGEATVPAEDAAVVESPEASDTAHLEDATDPDPAPASTDTDVTEPLEPAVSDDPEPQVDNQERPSEPLADESASPVADTEVHLDDPPIPEVPEEVLTEDPNMPGEPPAAGESTVPAEDAAVVESPEASDTAPLEDATYPDHAPDSTATDGTAPLDTAVPVDPEPHDVNPVFPSDPLAEAPASSVGESAVNPVAPPIPDDYKVSAADPAPSDSAEEAPRPEEREAREDETIPTHPGKQKARTKGGLDPDEGDDSGHSSDGGSNEPLSTSFPVEESRSPAPPPPSPPGQSGSPPPPSVSPQIPVATPSHITDPKLPKTIVVAITPPTMTKLKLKHVYTTVPKIKQDKKEDRAEIPEQTVISGHVAILFTQFGLEHPALVENLMSRHPEYTEAPYPFPGTQSPPTLLEWAIILRLHPEVLEEVFNIKEITVPEAKALAAAIQTGSYDINPLTASSIAHEKSRDQLMSRVVPFYEKRQILSPRLPKSQQKALEHPTEIAVIYNPTHVGYILTAMTTDCLVNGTSMIQPIPTADSVKKKRR
jgi:hypothetical protein